jgi:uncharacterized protein
MKQPGQHLSRRHFLQWLAGVALGGSTLYGYSRVLEPQWVEVTHVSLPIPHLPEHLIGKTIAQLSDIHLSEYTGPEQLQQAITLVNQLAPDWLFLTGDYVGDQAAAAQGLIEPLRQVAMPTFAVYGNHDYWSNLSIVTDALRETPVQILHNGSIQLATELWVAGVDDLWSGAPDLSRALRDVPAGGTTLLLAHEPDFFDQVVATQAPVAVQFSGHSHGGQVRLPLVVPGADGQYTYAPILPKYGRRYPIGLRQINQRQVYTNRGLGVWPVPFRFNCRPEITLFSLTSVGSTELAITP